MEGGLQPLPTTLSPLGNMPPAVFATISNWKNRPPEAKLNPRFSSKRRRRQAQVTGLHNLGQHSRHAPSAPRLLHQLPGPAPLFDEQQ